MDQLLLEIREQPQVLRTLLGEGYAAAQEVARAIRQRQIDSVLIAARGTSDNAATYAKYLLGAQHGLPVALAAPSLYTIYENPPRLRNTLVLAISQSGVSPDIVSVAQSGRQQGMLTVAITNNTDSPLARAADHSLWLRAGEERSIAATKTYTASLMSIALLSVALSDDASFQLQQLERVPDWMSEAIGLNEGLSARAERYRYADSLFVAGRGYNLCTAFELALKLKELTYITASSYSTADLMHGPIAVVGPGYPVLVVAPSGRALPDLEQLLEVLRARDAELLVVSDDASLLSAGRTPLALPLGVPEWLSPLVAVVPGQLLAHHIALSRGLDPTRPRGLQKVTETF